MGQCYNIDGRLTFRNEEEAMELAKNMSVGMFQEIFDKIKNLSDVKELLAYLFRDCSYCDGTLSACFDASYGWEWVFMEVLQAIAPALSELDLNLWMDGNTYHVFIGSDGRVEEKYVPKSPSKFKVAGTIVYDDKAALPNLSNATDWLSDEDVARLKAAKTMKDVLMFLFPDCSYNMADGTISATFDAPGDWQDVTYDILRRLSDCFSELNLRFHDEDDSAGYTVLFYEDGELQDEYSQYLCDSCDNGESDYTISGTLSIHNEEKLVKAAKDSLSEEDVSPTTLTRLHDLHDVASFVGFLFPGCNYDINDGTISGSFRTSRYWIEVIHTMLTSLGKHFSDVKLRVHVKGPKEESSLSYEFYQLKSGKVKYRKKY